MAHFKTTPNMKTQLNKMTKLWTLILSSLSLIACQNQNANIPYKVGQSYIYQVTVSDSNSTILQIDTLTMIVKNKGLIGGILGLNMADWKSTKFKEGDQERGINLESEFVEIQVPTNYDYLENENIVIAGYPSYSKSMLTGYTSESEHQFIKGYGKLSNTKLMQFKIIKDSSKVKFHNDSFMCQVAEYNNITGAEKYGLFKLKSYYNNEYGFLKMEYKYPNGKVIDFILIAIKNETETIDK